MSTSIVPPTTGASLASQAAEAELWQKGFDVYQQSEDFWKPFEGTRKTAPILIKKDTSKGAGHTINIRNMAGFYMEAKMGDETFASASDFEKAKINDYQLTIDVLRHATSFTENAEERMGIRGELDAGLPEELGKWYGREKTHKLFMMFLHLGTAANTYFINGATDRDAITATDTLSVDSITEAGVRLERLNGKPAMVGTDLSGNSIFKYCVTASTDALFSLKKDSDYKQQAREAGERGSSNLLFSGGYHELDGQVIKKYNPIDHDGDGPIGSPITAKADLGAAVSAGTATFDVKGGGNATAAAITSIKYFRDFPNYDYRFRTGDSLGVGSADFYVAIVNLSGADNGKFGFYKCVGNDGNKLTVTERLGSAASGIRATQVGDVTYDAAVNTEDHPEGSAVLFCNAKGVPIGRTIVMGQAAALRGYGLHDGKRGTETDEDGFLKEVYIRGYFAQTPRLDARDRAPGYMVVEHALEYAGIPLNPTLA
jgi:hypothetical protein